MSVSMTMNGAVLPILAFYIIAGEEQGVQPTGVGTIQNDILKEFMVRNTYIHAIAFRTHHRRHLPVHVELHANSIPSQSLATTCKKPVQYRAELHTLADGLEYVRTGMAAGLDIDAFAPRLSFSGRAG